MLDAVPRVTQVEVGADVGCGAFEGVDDAAAQFAEGTRVGWRERGHHLHAVAGGEQHDLAGPGSLLEIGEARRQIGRRHGQALADLDGSAAMGKSDHDDHPPTPSMARAT